MIPDCEIMNTDPETLIKEYSNLVHHIANKYRFALKYTAAIGEDDLLQSGRIGLLQAQKRYKPGSGSFMTYAYLRISSQVRRTAGIDNNGELPEELISLDKPVSEDQPDGETLMDLIQDPTIQDNAEHFAEEAEKEEIKKDVHEAIERLPREEYKSIIRKYYFNNESTLDIAEDMDITPERARTLKKTALHRLQADYHLRKYCPAFHVGVKEFNTTHTSMVEKLLLWREKQLESMFGEGAFFSTHTESSLSPSPPYPN